MSTKSLLSFQHNIWGFITHVTLATDITSVLSKLNMTELHLHDLLLLKDEFKNEHE